ncbi:MAG: 50S ribosomal protein L22 [Candidatus Micrarchaeia archaeon]
MTETYAFQKESTKRTARARLTGINASFKDLGEVCRAVRYKPTDEAIEFLERASVMEQAIPMRRHGKGRGHVRQLGGQQGGWPVKSVKIVLGVVKSAFANANKLGVGSTKIVHIIANKEHTFPRMSPKGRRIVHNFETAFVEVVLQEWQPKEAEKKGEKAEKKSAAKQSQAKSTGVKAAEQPAKKTEAKAATTAATQ